MRAPGKLKPCPNAFCSGKPMIMYRNGPKPGVMCKKCGLRKWFEGTLEEVITAWNLRPLEDELVTALKAIQQLCIDEETAPTGCAPLRTQVYDEVAALLERIEGETG